MEGTPKVDRFLYWGTVGLGLAGLLVAGYLTYIKWFPSTPFCTGVGDCEAVNTSVYSQVAGIPVALLGAIAYATILIVAMLEPRLPLAGEWGSLVVLGVSFSGVLYSAYLTYIEIAVIRKICPYCMASAVIITLICVLAGMRVHRKWLA